MSRLTLWPHSLFGRLVATSVLAVLLAQLAGLVLIAHERERFVLQERVRDWSRRIAEITFMLQPLDASGRAAATDQLIEQGMHGGRRTPAGPLSAGGMLPPGDLPMPPPPRPRLTFLRLPLGLDLEGPLQQTLETQLGAGYQVSVATAGNPGQRVIPISPIMARGARDDPDRLYEVTVRFPDGYSAVFGVVRPAEGAPLPRNLFINLIILVVIMAIALFAAARSITRPLSQLARAADSVGRDLRQPKLEETGARELRDAARAFNTMQDRLQRYLDSRTRVLAAMSHDLKTPLTRLRLQVETLEDAAAQARIGKQLDEMESMVRGALALFRGLDDREELTPVNIDALLATLQAEFAQMGSTVAIEGHARGDLVGKPQALKRCLTNLLENAVKFGTRATVRVEEDGEALVIRVEDDGPGVPPEELERVFEPFYRVESSRNRDTGGTGLGLSIARDIAQAHGGSLRLENLPQRGLRAILSLPREPRP
jgi:signal transduction histidine kinase